MELSLSFPRRVARRRARRRRQYGAVSSTRAGHALDWLRGHRLAWRVALGVLVSVPLLGGGWLWLRDSSLVSIRHVHIVGVHGKDALEIRQALDNAAARMTTMDFDAGALRSAVSSFAIVGALHATTSFPHSVSIAVVERPPVAALLSAGQRTAVAADGTVLGPALLSSSLPTISGSVEPPTGARLRETAALAAVTVLGAAPAALAPFVVRAFSGPEGLTLAMRNGLIVYFGDALRPHAKWLSLARVLVSPSAAGASYVDVRLPERPAAGFSSISSASTSTPLQVAASEPTAAALAASLSRAAGGSAGAATGAHSGTGESEGATPAGETTSGSSTAAGIGEGEASSGSSGGSAPSGGESSSAALGGGARSGAPGATSEAPASSTGGASSTAVPGG
jgi:cell division protein FtsQ